MTDESPNPDRPTATRASFVPTDGTAGRMHINVYGRGFVERAAPLVAKLGRQYVRRIMVNEDGSGFAGILEQSPQPGDRLTLGYADGPLATTDVVFGADDSGPRIA